MKLKIESLKNSDVKITLQFAGKTFSETWYKHEDGSERTREKGIITQMEDAGIVAEGTDIEELLNSITMLNFMDLVESEADW